MWIRLLSTKYIDIRGKQTKFSPGDWVEVGRQTALLWVNQGAAEIPNPERWGKFDIPGEAGVRVLANIEGIYPALAPFSENLVISNGPVELPYQRTMLWNPRQYLRRELVPLGFYLLDTWQIALPLQDYQRLAIRIGSDEERACTQKIIHDLRVPLYSTDLMFIKKCDVTEQLIELWQTGGGDSSLSFLRALYLTKPLVLALPPTWTERNAQPN